MPGGIRIHMPGSADGQESEGLVAQNCSLRWPRRRCSRRPSVRPGGDRGRRPLRIWRRGPSYRKGLSSACLLVVRNILQSTTDRTTFTLRCISVTSQNLITERAKATNAKEERHSNQNGTGQNNLSVLVKMVKLRLLQLLMFCDLS